MWVVRMRVYYTTCCDCLNIMWRSHHISTWMHYSLYNAAPFLMIKLLWLWFILQGAFFGFILGTIAGIVRLVIEWSVHKPLCNEPDTRPSVIKDFHYLYFAIGLFLLTGSMITIISLLTAEIHPKHVSSKVKLLWKTIETVNCFVEADH